MNLNLNGKTALITASSSGIGRAIAEVFLEEGARVIINGLSADLAGKGGRWSEILRDDPDATEAYIQNNVPMKRFGTPCEIADAVVFLSSERSEFTTGACLVADGGQSGT